jgi:hypothetical protein
MTCMYFFYNCVTLIVISPSECWFKCDNPARVQSAELVNATNTVEKASWAYENVYYSGINFMKAQGMIILENNQTTNKTMADVTNPEYIYLCGEVKNGYYDLGHANASKASINFKLTTNSKGLDATICNCDADGEDVCDLLKKNLDLRLKEVKTKLESVP